MKLILIKFLHNMYLYILKFKYYFDKKSIYENDIQSELIVNEDNDISDSWKKFRCELLKNIKNSDIRIFMNWPIIKKTMVIGNVSYSKYQLRQIKNKRYFNAIQENWVGKPIKSIYMTCASGNTISYVYQIMLIETNFSKKIEDFDLILEFGAGYAGLARIIYSKFNFTNDYIIYDIKELTMIQNYYLKESNLKCLFNSFKSNQINIFDNVQMIKSIIVKKNKRNSLFIAAWSLSESPITIREEILHLCKNFTHIFIAFQDNFDSINNYEYFTNYFKINNYAFDLVKVPYMENNYFIFATIITK